MTFSRVDLPQLCTQNGQDENLFRLAYQHLQLAEYSFDKDSDGLQGDMTVTRSSSESVPGQMLDCVLMKRKSGKKCAFPCWFNEGTKMGAMNRRSINKRKISVRPEESKCWSYLISAS